MHARRTTSLAGAILSLALLHHTTTAQAASSVAREPAFGLPHLYADTDLELARLNGFEIAKDRLAQMILLGRVGRGTIYQAFGLLDPTTLADDVEARRTAYTSSELNAMFEAWPKRERDSALAYCAGVNDAIEAIYTGALPEPIEVDVIRNFLGLGDDLFGNRQHVSDQVDPFYLGPGASNPAHPFDGQHPTAGFQFTPEMVVAIAILEVRNFGIEGFGEAARLAELQALIAKHGPTAGAELWDDLNFLNDPLAPPTVPDPTTPGYGGPLAARPATSRLAAIAARHPVYDYRGAARALAERRTHRAELARMLGAWPMLGSYAWVIAGGKSATGWPWLGGFPQTGIQTPSLMHFAENRSGEGSDHRIQGIGMEFAGAGPVILIGQTDSVAYTSTTAQLRVLDTVFEHLIGEDSDVLRYDDEGVPAPLSPRTEIFLGVPPVTRRFWRSHERGGDGGSRPVEDFLGDAEGTADAGSPTSLVDAGAFDEAFAGGHVAIVDGTGAGQIRAVGAVPDAHTLQVSMPWTTAPDATSVYVASRAGTDLIAAAVDSPTWKEETTTGLGFLLLQRSEDVLDVRAASRLMPSTHNFPSADNRPFNGIGTASGMGGNIAYFSSGFSRIRQDGTDPRLPLDGSQPNPLVVARGTLASAGASDLTAAGSPFAGLDLSPEPINLRYDDPAQVGREFVVTITTGNGARQSRRIAGNTDATLTVEHPWGGDPDGLPAAGDTFAVYEIAGMPEAVNPTEGYMANWNNKAATADEGDNFGRQFRIIFINERLAAESAWDREKQRRLNADVAGLEGRGAFGRYLIPRLRQAVNVAGNGGNPAVDSVLAALETHQAAPAFGRFFVDPVHDTTAAGAIAFLNDLVNRLAHAIYGDEYATAIDVPSGGRALNVVQHAIDSAADDLPGAYRQSYRGDYFQSVGSFLCYKTKRSKGAPRFRKVKGVALSDRFESATASLRQLTELCAPANANDEGLHGDPALHLASYLIKTSPKHGKQHGVVVRDRFGTVTVNTVKADRLLVPTAKALDAAAPAPAGGLDHYKCHKVRRTKGTPAFESVQVQASDQLEDRLYDVLKPRHLCTPVSANGEEVADAVRHLLCYRAKAAKGQAKHARLIGRINTANQFGEARLDTKVEAELCVPATIDGTGGWEVLVRDTLSELATAGIPADAPRSQSRYDHPLSALFPELEFPPTPAGNRGTWEQIVEAGPVVKGEFMFPLGQSGLVEGDISGVTAIDPNVTSIHPVWRDWRFLPLLPVGEDLATGGPDADADGVFDAFERWYFGDLSRPGTDDGDADGATLLEEFGNGSDPTDADTDDDGAPDGSDAAPQDRLVS